MSDYGQDLVDRGLEILKGKWEYQGDEKDLLVEDISYPDFKLAQQYGALSAQLNGVTEENAGDLDADALQEQVENLGDFSWEDEGDEDFIATMIEHKLVRPEVDPETLPASLLRALVQGMMETWYESENVAAAKEEMPIEGNP